jgi:UDP-glucose 4-epimerase
VHVDDVAGAHEFAINRSFPGGIYNVGIEHGASNLEVIQTAQQVTGKLATVLHTAARPGDPSQLVATNEKLCSQGWRARYSLEDMVRHAWAWYVR